ncbi:MAG: aspartyl protease family protein [Winogradskyella sp.]
MNLLPKHIVLYFFVFAFSTITAQGEFSIKRNKSEKIRFKLINNLMIIPVSINGVTLSFVLDTGVSKPILFNLADSDSLEVKNVETIFLHGLGSGGKIEALKSNGNRFTVGNATKENQTMYVVYDNNLDFGLRLGLPIHGIIGYDLFKDFIVEVNYTSTYIRLHNRKFFKPKTSKKWKQIPIDIIKRKPYINAKVTIGDSKTIVKLLIDTGGSDALWLFEEEKKGLVPDKNLYFDDYLGAGLSGAVYGKRSKVAALELSDFQLNKVNVAYPDSTSIALARKQKNRNGSIAGGILKRFNYFFDYNNEMLYLKKNYQFKTPFYYNNSGITFQHNGVRVVKQQINKINRGSYTSKNNENAKQIDFSINYVYSLKPAFQIVEIRETSNAYKVGLRKGDVLISINGKPSYNLDLNKINASLYNKEGKVVTLRIERNQKQIKYQFKLDNVFKKQELSKK